MIASSAIRPTSEWIAEARKLAANATSTLADGSPHPEPLWRTLIADRSRTEWPAPDEYANSFEIFCRSIENDGWPATGVAVELKRLASPTSPLGNNLKSDYPVVRAALLYGVRMKEAWTRRQFAVSSHNRLALVPLLTRPGDIVCVIQELPTPFVLRQCSAKAQTSNMTSDTDLENTLQEPGNESQLSAGRGLLCARIMAGEMMDETAMRELTIV